MSPAQFSLATRRALGVTTELGEAGGQCHARTCTGPSHSRHALTCPKTGLQNSLHHHVVRGVTAVLRYASAGPVRHEDAACFAGPRAVEGHTFRMDLTAPSGAVSGARSPHISNKQLLVDVSVRSPCSTQALNRHSGSVQGTAAALAETAKAQHYAGTFVPAISTLVCFAVETYGLLGAQAESLLEELATHKANSEVVPGATSAVALRAKHLARMRQIVSVSLQTGLSNRELAYVQLQRSRGQGGAPFLERLWDEGDWAASRIG